MNLQRKVGKKHGNKREKRKRLRNSSREYTTKNGKIIPKKYLIIVTSYA
jgi:hypothetical protein